MDEAPVTTHTMPPKMGRRDFTRRFVKGVVGGLLLGGTASCRRNDAPSPTASDNGVLGQAAIYYGVPTPELNGFAFAVIEPGNIPPRLAPANAVAYCSLTGVNQDNGSLAALRQSLESADGYLQDARGNKIYDPNGLPAPPALGTYMVDVRRPEIRQMMKEHCVSLAASYKRGVFLDAIDSAIALENAQPAICAGLIDGAIQLMREINAEIDTLSTTYAPKSVIVNGGLYQRTSPGPDVLSEIAKTTSYLVTETQCFSAPDVPRTPSDIDWTRARLTVACQAAAQSGKSSLTLIAIDPATAGQQKHAACTATQFYDRLAQDVRSTGCALHILPYLCDMQFTNPADLAQNAALRTTSLCR